MLRVFCNIKVGTIELPFVTDYSIETSSEKQTQGGTVTFPKNLYYRNEYGKLLPLGGANVKIGDLIKRGDKITISSGYYGFSPINVVFEGYVSQVGSKTPVELKIEDNMWVLKQTPAKAGVYTTLESLLSALLQGTGFTFQTMADITTIGQFIVGNESVSQVLQRLEKDYKFTSYFVGSLLRCGIIQFDTSKSTEAVFNFQKNIIEDDLNYTNKDDVKMSCIASNTIEESTGGTTQDGAPKTKKKTLRALIEFTEKGTKVASDGTRYNVKDVSSGSVPTAEEGERYDYFFLGATTIDELGRLGAEQLLRAYYTGFRGTFTTFGAPFMRIGDIANLQDSVLPERNGRYEINGVTYSCSSDGGLRQVIDIATKLS